MCSSNKRFGFSSLFFFSLRFTAQAKFNEKAMTEYSPHAWKLTFFSFSCPFLVHFYFQWIRQHCGIVCTRSMKIYWKKSTFSKTKVNSSEPLDDSCICMRKCAFSWSRAINTPQHNNQRLWNTNERFYLFFFLAFFAFFFSSLLSSRFTICIHFVQPPTLSVELQCGDARKSRKNNNKNDEQRKYTFLFYSNEK